MKKIIKLGKGGKRVMGEGYPCREVKEGLCEGPHVSRDLKE